MMMPEALKPERVTSENLPKFLTKRDPRSEQAEGEDFALTERRRGIGVESQPRRPASTGRRPLRWILVLVVLLIIAAGFYLSRPLDCVDIHLVQIDALTRHRIDRNALGVWS